MEHVAAASTRNDAGEAAVAVMSLLSKQLLATKHSP